MVNGDVSWDPDGYEVRHQILQGFPLCKRKKMIRNFKTGEWAKVNGQWSMINGECLPDRTLFGRGQW